MISKIRKSRTFKGISVLLILSMCFEIVAPTVSFALTGGPQQPEFASFTPIGVTDMVDLASGDMNYNIPLLDVGGYPLNIAYSAGSGMDEEASWVGLGWNLSVGQINRNVRGIPDDFKGDQLKYENYQKRNITVGANFTVNPDAFGVDLLNLNLGAAAMYNNYTGFSITPSAGITLDLGKNASIGFNVSSGDDGLSISPNMSIHAQSKTKNNRNNNLGANVGVSWNSRNGVSQMTFGVSRQRNFLKTANNRTRNGNQRIDGSQSIGSSIGFAEQLYTPSRRVGMETGSFTVNAAVEGEVFGVEGQGQITGYGTVTVVRPGERDKSVAAYGYANTEYGDEYSVLDFNREKDGNFSVSMNNLPVTNYTYDIYSVQGQGVSGMYRPFRNQVGYVYDARVDDGSNSSSLGLEIGAGNSVHVGVDIEVTNVNSHSGLWSDANSILGNLQEQNGSNGNYERVHYKNVGDLSADADNNIFENIGEYNAIRVPYTGSEFNRMADSRFIRKNFGNNETSLIVGGAIQRSERQKRNQAIMNLTKGQVLSGAGYSPFSYGGLNWNDVVATGQNHHTAEVQIIRNDGARYVYGLPAYNTHKVEATFSVENNGNCLSGLVGYSASDLVAGGTTMAPTWDGLPGEKYLNRITTPPFVHTHLLTSVLSTDYSDLEGNGPTPDDYGSYTKFTYTAYEDATEGNASVYRWRVPYEANMATYNEGLKTLSDDDQGSYEYGEKQLYFVKTIETKTHIAVFKISPRADAKGVLGPNGGMSESQHSYKLDKISLYSVGEYYEADGVTPVANPTPIKEVHFEYSYSLCPNVPNNHAAHTLNQDGSVELSNFGGKLTLKKIYFTYRNSKMGKYTAYTFNYGEFVNGLDEYSNPNLSGLVPNTPGAGGTGTNPEYHIKGYDSWGNYKPVEATGCDNDDPPTNAEFHYTDQNRDEQNIRAQVWCLKKIKLPSGGIISIDYESDSYSSVQDKGINRMFTIAGAGTSSTGTGNVSDELEDLFTLGWTNDHTNYLYADLGPTASLGTVTATDYLSGMPDDLIQFRFYMNMTDLANTSGGLENAHFDYVSGYFKLDEDWASNASIFQEGSNSYLSIPVNMVDGKNPIALASWQFARKFTSKISYGTQPNTSNDDVEAIVNQLVNTSMFDDLMEIFEGPNGPLENKGVGRRFYTNKSWVRLKHNGSEKLGGGCRVTEVRMSDLWDEMTANSGYQTMNYGQQYNYDLDNGLSSGVATYEPIGNKENPFVQPVFSSTDKLLAPDEENYVEKPFGESFFPSPQVTYSKVSVSSLKGGTNPVAPGNPELDVKVLHKTGRVVTEFYTSKDYPTIVNQTAPQYNEDRADALDNILSLNVRKHYTISQGYVVHLNDMNGKQKSQRVYAEGQSAAISGVDYRYDNHPSTPGMANSGNPDQDKGRLDNNVLIINPDGSMTKRIIGVETDVVQDFRLNTSTTRISGVNTNLAAFIAATFPITVPVPLPDYSQTSDLFRSAGTTKVINTFGILKETVAYDAGAAVYTRNLAWDGFTGEVLVTETVDEFNDKYYTMNYPAHWYYTGMGQASHNLGMGGTLTQIIQGEFSTSGATLSFFEPGDEIFVFTENALGAIQSSQMGWVMNVTPNSIEVADAEGNPFELLDPNNPAEFRVVRSGRRNLQSAGIMNVTLMKNPVGQYSGGTAYLDDDFLVTDPNSSTSNWENWKIINAGAVDYSDAWDLACECGINTGYSIYNPYRRNEKGVWRTKSSRTYLTGRTSVEDLVAISTNASVTPRLQGFFTSFVPMYIFQSGELEKDFNGWTFVAEVSNYSPYGFELENMDALNRYSAAQYGYNNTFPMAVGANTRYSELGFDGFEDYMFDEGCPYSAHFNFQGSSSLPSDEESHSGKYSIKVAPNSRATMKKKLACEP